MSEDEIQKIKYRDPTSDYTRGFNSGVDAIITSGQFISVKELREKVEERKAANLKQYEYCSTDYHDCSYNTASEEDDWFLAQLPKSQEKIEA